MIDVILFKTFLLFFTALSLCSCDDNKQVESAPLDKEIVKDQSFLSPEIYIQENLKLSFSRFDNETTTQRDVVFDVTVCLKRTDDKKIGKKIIEVHKIRSKNGTRQIAKRPLMSNQCVTWEDSFRHKYFMPERKVLKKFLLKNSDLGLNEDVPVLINPWDFGWTFGRYASLQEKEVLDREKAAIRPPSKFYLRDYRFVEEGVSYKVDDELTLTQSTKLRFSLDVKVERSSSQTKGVNQVEKLRKGQYLFRILVRRNNFENIEKAHEYITHAQTITTVIDGNLIADIELPILDQGLLRSRNRILIELATVHEDKIISTDEIHFRPKKGLTYDDIINSESGLDRAVFEGPIILSNASYSNRVREYLLNDFVSVRDNFVQKYSKSRSNAFLKTIIPALEIPIINSLSKHIGLGLMQKQADSNITKSLAKNYPQHSRLSYYNISQKAEELTHKLYKKQSKKIKLGFDRLKRFIHNPHQDKELKKTICQHFSDYFLNASFFNGYELVPRNGPYKNQLDMVKKCFKGLKPGPIKSLVSGIKGERTHLGSFSFIRQYITKKVSFLSHVKGIPYTYSIRNGYSLGMSKKISLDTGLKVSAPGSIFGISGGSGIDWSQALSTSTGFGLDLTVEENIEALRFHKPEKCLVIRYSKNMLKELKLNLYALKRLRGEQEYLKAIAQLHSMGLLLCHDTKEDMTKNEHYYYLEQSHGPGIFQDVTDQRNRQVRLKMRGRNEFFTFVENFEGELKNPMSVFTKPELFRDIYDFMTNHINLTPANYPGVYTDLEESIELRSHYLNQ